jgi:RNA polymerase sigma factor for flagellar operon FliA
MSNITFISFEEIGCSSSHDKSKIADCLAQKDQDVFSLAELRELQTALSKAIEELPEKEKLVLSLYYMDELTMKETGEVVGVTESRVSQLHSQAIIRLRSKLRKKGLLRD